MDIKQLFINHFNRPSDYVPPVGRYSASNIHYIMQGWVTPESFFSKSVIDEDGVRRMHRGMCYEDGLSKLFDKSGLQGYWGEHQRKYLIDITNMNEEGGWKYKVYDVSDKKQEPDLKDRVVLVCKPDYCFTKTVFTENVVCSNAIIDVIELKCPEEPKYFDDIPDKYKPQLECEYRATSFFNPDKTNGLPNVYLAIAHSPIDIFTYKFKSSEIKWRNMCTKMLAFDKEVRKVSR